MTPDPDDIARHPVLLLSGVGLLALALFVLISQVVPDAAAFAVAIPLATIVAVVGVVELGGLRRDHVEDAGPRAPER